MTPEERKDERENHRRRMVEMMETALRDTDELSRHPGPYTWGIAFYDGLFFPVLRRQRQALPRERPAGAGGRCLAVDHAQQALREEHIA